MSGPTQIGWYLGLDRLKLGCGAGFSPDQFQFISFLRGNRLGFLACNVVPEAFSSCLMLSSACCQITYLSSITVDLMVCLLLLKFACETFCTCYYCRTIYLLAAIVSLLVQLFSSPSPPTFLIPRKVSAYRALTRQYKLNLYRSGQGPIQV